MKKALLVLLFILSFSLLCSCGVKNGEQPSKEEALQLSPLSEWQNYSIIYPSEFGDIEKSEVLAFINRMRAIYGKSVPATNDFVIPGEAPPSSTLEILIGLTNRAESQAAHARLGADEFCITFDGGRLVIIGESEKATLVALEFAKEKLLCEDGIYYPTNEIMKKAEYNKISICDVDISEFEILYGDKDYIFGEELAKDINGIISSKLKISLPYAKESDSACEHAIILSEDDSLADEGCKIYEDGGNLVIAYDCAANAYHAIKLLEEIFNSQKDVSLPAGYVSAKSIPTYKIVMFGASNTQMGYLTYGVDMYLQMQYGDITYEFKNLGRSGGSASSAMKNYNGQFKSRVEREIYDDMPDAVVLQFFFNGIGPGGVTTNSQTRTIERAWDRAKNAEFDINTAFDAEGNFIGVDKMKELYPSAFTVDGRLNFKTITYASDEEFEKAYLDVERTAYVKHEIDSTFPVKLEKEGANITEFSKSMYNFYRLVSDLHAHGVTVYVTTPVNYDEEWESTKKGERIIGIKYIHNDVTAFFKEAFADMDNVYIWDYSAPSLELKYQLRDSSNSQKSYTSDRKHFSKMSTAPYAIATAPMVDMLGQNIVPSADETLAKDYVAYSEILADGTVKTDNADVTDVVMENGKLYFTYKPHGVSVAAIGEFEEARQIMANGKYEQGIEKYSENVNREIIKVSGLDDDKTYKITIGSSTLANTYTGAELALGVDISLVKGNPSTAVASKIAEVLETKRSSESKIRSLAYVRETQFFKRGLDDSVASKELIMETLEKILIDYPSESNYTHQIAVSYMNMYDTLHEYESTVSLCEYTVKKLLDFDAYKVTIEEANN